jgi:anti-sigma B factor antagonist
MEIEVQERAGVSVLALHGEVKLGEPTRLLREKSRELVDAGRRFLVLDMLDVPWLDSSGIGEVFACYKRARQKGGVVKLVVRDRSLSLFVMAQLDGVFEIFADVDAAVASFNGAS